GHLPLSANGELLETPLPEAGVDAFGHHSTFIDTFAVRAAHAAPPLGNAGTVIVARGIGVGPMLALRRRSIDLDALACGPFRVAVVVETAINQMPLGQSAVIALEFVKHRPHEAAVGAIRLGVGGHDDLALRDSADLAVIGRPVATIRHLHDASFRISSRGARLALFGDVLLIGAPAPLTLLLEF